MWIDSFDNWKRFCLWFIRAHFFQQRLWWWFFMIGEWKWGKAEPLNSPIIVVIVAIINIKLTRVKFRFFIFFLNLKALVYTINFIVAGKILVITIYDFSEMSLTSRATDIPKMPGGGYWIDKIPSEDTYVILNQLVSRIPRFYKTPPNPAASPSSYQFIFISTTWRLLSQPKYNRFHPVLVFFF